MTASSAYSHVHSAYSVFKLPNVRNALSIGEIGMIPRGKPSAAPDTRPGPLRSGRLVSSAGTAYRANPFLPETVDAEAPMKKVSLNPDQLRVESFTTEEVPASRGTVDAHARTPVDCPVQTDPPACGTVMRMSCYASCTDPEFCAVI
jgi:hypothetical protein